MIRAGGWMSSHGGIMKGIKLGAQSRGPGNSDNQSPRTGDWCPHFNHILLPPRGFPAHSCVPSKNLYFSHSRRVKVLG